MNKLIGIVGLFLFLSGLLITSAQVNAISPPPMPGGKEVNQTEKPPMPGEEAANITNKTLGPGSEKATGILGLLEGIFKALFSIFQL